MKDWHSKVYRMRDDKDDMMRSEWREIRAAVLARDYFMCQRCEKKSKSGKGLSVHHIVPRDEGGSNDMTNLITLCDPCHDYVEIQGYRSRADIMAYEEAHVKARKRLPTKDVDLNDWHTWVYGGYPNPNLRTGFTPNATESHQERPQ